MSRIGKQPVIIPAGVTVTVTNGLVAIKGPKGQLTHQLHRLVMATETDNQLVVSVKNPEDKKQGALWGLSQRLLANMVTGVTTGFSKQLEINGVGYKAAVQGAVLVITIGYSHPVNYAIPAGIEMKVEKNIVTVSGIDKQQVGQVASEIRAVRRPEPYKGKGIKYVDEIIRRKAGKAATKSA